MGVFDLNRFRFVVYFANGNKTTFVFPAQYLITAVDSIPEVLHDDAPPGDALNVYNNGSPLAGLALDPDGKKEKEKTLEEGPGDGDVHV